MTIAGNDFGDQPSETDERKGDEEPTYRLHHILRSKAILLFIVQRFKNRAM